MSMMIHRHFDGEGGENATKLADIAPGRVTEDEFNLHAPLSGGTEEAPKRRGRQKKTDNDN